MSAGVILKTNGKGTRYHVGKWVENPDGIEIVRPDTVVKVFSDDAPKCQLIDGRAIIRHLGKPFLSVHIDKVLRDNIIAEQTP